MRAAILSLALALAPIAAGAQSARDMTCLTEAIYFEARGEPEIGQRAVAETILNRVQLLHERGGRASICGIVYAPSQFSWTRRVDRTPRDAEALARARRIAHEAASEPRRVLRIHGAQALFTHFYDPQRAAPAWARHAEHGLRIGGHVFLALRQGT